MQDESLQARFEPPAVPSIASPETASWAPPGIVDARALSAIEARLEEARGEHHRGNDSTALRILREVTSRLEASSGPVTEKTTGMALLASAYAMLGQILPKLNLKDRTPPQLLARAAEIFQQLETSARVAVRQYYSEYGIALRLLGHDQRALTILRQAAEDGSATSEALRHLGELLDKQGEHDAAAEFLHRAADKAPSNAEVRVLLAGVLERAGQPIEAAEVYREAGLTFLAAGQLDAAAAQLGNSLRLAPDVPYTLSLLGQVAVLQEEPERAAWALERALAVEPGYFPALMVRAWQLRMSGDYPSALEVAKQADAVGPQQIAPKIMIAELLEERGEIAEARSWVDAALKLAPDAADLLTRKSRLLWLAGAWEEALVLADRALQLDPDLTPALMVKGTMLATLGRLAEAAQTFRQVIAFDPTSADALAYLGIVCRYQGQLGEALEVLDSALKIQPTHALALATKGQIVLTTDAKQAAELLERALQANDRLVWLWADLAMAREILEDHEGALEAVNRGLDHNPEEAVLLFRKASVLVKQGRLDEADRILTALLRSSPHHVDGLTLKAEIYFQEGEYHEVLTLAEQALTLEPNLVSALRLKALAQLYDGYPEKAIGTFRELLSLEPHLQDGWNWLGEAFLRLERYEDAEVAFDKSLALSGNPFAWGSKGQVALARGQIDRAVELLDKAIQLDEKLTWARAIRGRALAMLGRRVEALEDLDKVLQEEPDRLDPVFDKAEVLMEMGQAPEAVALVGPRAPEHPLLQAQYARALATAGQWAEAGQEFQAARERSPDHPWILSSYAKYCCDIGEFANGAELAREAFARSDPASAPYVVLGWALQNLGKKRAEEALQVYQEALRSVPGDPRYRRGLADSLRGLGRREEARHEYQQVLDGAAGGQESTYSHAVLGWCRYGLGQYDEAVRLYTLALLREIDPLPTHFDLALALLASGRSDLASQEYRNAADKAHGVHPFRRRGLFYVALYDLTDAQNNRDIPITGEDPSTRDIYSLLKHGFAEAGGRLESLGFGL